MSLGGSAGGVDLAAVLVNYLDISPSTRAALAVIGAIYTIASGFLIRDALGERVSLPTSVTSDEISRSRHLVSLLFIALSISSIAIGMLILIHPNGRSATAQFILADLLWAIGLSVATPWSRPGPRYVRDTWLIPAGAAMLLLTVVGVAFPSDYAAATLFFLPQLATAAYAVRGDEFVVAGRLVETRWVEASTTTA